jgi:hypothetical protein
LYNNQLGLGYFIVQSLCINDFAAELVYNLHVV